MIETKEIETITLEIETEKLRNWRLKLSTLITQFTGI